MTTIAIPTPTDTSPDQPGEVLATRYHGSLTDHHGDAWLVGRCECTRCQTPTPATDRPAVKDVLVTAAGQLLLHVSPTSHTTSSP